MDRLYLVEVSEKFEQKFNFCVVKEDSPLAIIDKIEKFYNGRGYSVESLYLVEENVYTDPNVPETSPTNMLYQINLVEYPGDFQNIVFSTSLKGAIKTISEINNGVLTLAEPYSLPDKFKNAKQYLTINFGDVIYIK